MVMAKVPEFLSPGSPTPQQDLGLDLHVLSITHSQALLGLGLT